MTWPHLDYRVQRRWIVRWLLGIWSRRLRTRLHLMWRLRDANWSPHFSPTQSKLRSPTFALRESLKMSAEEHQQQKLQVRARIQIFLKFIACSSKSCVLCDSCRSRRPKSPGSIRGQPSGVAHSRRRSTFTTEREGNCSTKSVLMWKGSTKMDSRTLHLR